MYLWNGTHLNGDGVHVTEINMVHQLTDTKQLRIMSGRTHHEVDWWEVVSTNYASLLRRLAGVTGVLKVVASGGNDLDPAAYKNMLHMAGISLSDGVFTATRSAGGFVGGAASDVLVPVVHALGYAMMAIIVVIILCILLFIAYRTSWGNGKRMLLSNKMRDTRQRIRDGCVRCRRKPKDKAEAPEGERLYPQIE